MFIKVDGKVYREVRTEDFEKEANARIVQIEEEMEFHKRQADGSTAKWNDLAAEKADLRKALDELADAK